MVHGGASFAAALAAHGLIDEYCLVMQPMAIDSGQRLFAKLPAPLRFNLVEARSFDCGVVVHIYRRELAPRHQDLGQAQPARTARAAG